MTEREAETVVSETFAFAHSYSAGYCKVPGIYMFTFSKFSGKNAMLNDPSFIRMYIQGMR